MRLRTQLRARDHASLSFRRDWIASGMSPTMTNAEVKGYLRNIRRDVVPEEPEKPGEKPENLSLLGRLWKNLTGKL